MCALDRGSAKEETLDVDVGSVIKKQEDASKPRHVKPTVEVEEVDAQQKPTAVFDPEAVELKDRCDSAYTPHVVPFENMGPISDGHSCEETQKVQTSLFSSVLRLLVEMTEPWHRGPTVQ